MIWRHHHYRICRKTFTLFSLLSAGGCASTIGMPQPVIRTQAMVALAQGDRFGIEAVLARDTGTAESRRQLRDQFIAIQLAAIDGQYRDFKGNLSRDMKEGKLTLELAVIALTSAGSIAGARAANLLSAAATGLAGSKTAISKELYAERALSAITAMMDTSRLQVKTGIVSRMREKSIDAYSIPEAIADLSAYEQAANLDGAVEEVVATALIDKKEAKAEYDRVVATCDPEKDVGKQWFRLAKALQSLDPARDQIILNKVSAIVGSDPNLPFDAQREAIVDQVGLTSCTVTRTKGLIERIRNETGMTIS